MFSQPNAKPFSKTGVRPTSQAVTAEATQRKSGSRGANDGHGAGDLHEGIARAIKPLARSSHDRQPIPESARDSWHRIDRLHVRADTGWDSNWLNDGKLLKKYVLSQCSWVVWEAGIRNHSRRAHARRGASRETCRPEKRASLGSERVWLGVRDDFRPWLVHAV
jgi:hypothetical protein